MSPPHRVRSIVSLLGEVITSQRDFAGTKRRRIARILLGELPWLHDQGWPEDRGVTVPSLSPRLRLVLNLLLDGGDRQQISSIPPK